jgi:bifunctional non-homologous end joining protein LigD
LVSRDGRDHARRFDELAAAIAKLSARSLALDGEVAIFDQRLRSRFDWLREPDPAAVATPPVLIVFDIMYRDRRDLAELPLSARRIRLQDVITGAWPRTASTHGRRSSASTTRAWSPKDEASVYEGG